MIRATTLIVAAFTGKALKTISKSPGMQLCNDVIYLITVDPMPLNKTPKPSEAIEARKHCIVLRY